MDSLNTNTSGWFYVAWLERKILKSFINFKSLWGCLRQKITWDYYIIWKEKCPLLIFLHRVHRADCCRHVMPCVCVMYSQALRRLGVTDVRTRKVTIDSMRDGISQRANSFFLYKPQGRHQYDFEEFCLCVNNHMKNGVTEVRLLNDPHHFFYLKSCINSMIYRMSSWQVYNEKLHYVHREIRQNW